MTAVTFLIRSCRSFPFHLTAASSEQISPVSHRTRCPRMPVCAGTDGATRASRSTPRPAPPTPPWPTPSATRLSRSHKSRIAFAQQKPDSASFLQSVRALRFCERGDRMWARIRAALNGLVHRVHPSYARSPAARNFWTLSLNWKRSRQQSRTLEAFRTLFSHRKQLGFQFLFPQAFRQRPTDPGCRRSFQILVNRAQLSLVKSPSHPDVAAQRSILKASYVGHRFAIAGRSRAFEGFARARTTT